MIPYFRPDINQRDVNEVVKIIKSRRLADGSTVSRFESALSHYLGDELNVAVVSSGSAALYLALRALDVGKNDEVIIPTYACSSLLHSIILVGGKPIIVDIDPDTWNLDINLVSQVITKKTKAIVLTHTYGSPVNALKFKSFGIPIVEDCAQSLGAMIWQKMVGTIGDIGICSFYAAKLITTGHGGAVWSTNQKLIQNIKSIRNYDTQPFNPGHFNFLLTDIQAALGISQLSRINQFLHRRQKIAKTYLESIRSIEYIKPQKKIAEADRVYHRFVITGKKINFLKTISEMEKKGITIINPLTPDEQLHRILHLSNNNYPVSEELSAASISLPIYPGLTQKQLKITIDVLNKLLKEK